MTLYTKFKIGKGLYDNEALDKNQTDIEKFLESDEVK